MNFLERFKIKAKLAVIVGISAAALALALTFAGSMQRQRMIDDRIDKLHAIVDAAYGLAQSLEDEVAAGHISRDEAIARFRGSVHSMWYDGRQGYVLMATMDGTFIAQPVNPKLVGTRGTVDPETGRYIIDSFVEVMKSADEGTVSYLYPKPGQTERLPKYTYMKKFKPWNAFIATGLYIDDIETAYRSVLIRLGAIGLAIIAAAAAIAFLISRSISGSLGKLKAKMEQLAAGDLDVDIGEARRHDEIGDMAKAVDVFKDSAIAMQRLQAEQDDIKRRAERDKRVAMEMLAENFERQVRGVVAAVTAAATQMQSTARSMSETAAGTRQQTLAVAAGANQATANVQTVAAASEELSASIGDIGRQVSQASTVARQAAAEGQRTNATISGLAQAVQRIGDVVALIDDIASQTNLLALNATIEAARAGDAGKGFAVVASEVKALATQTAKATDDIRGQIGTVQTETGSAVAAIHSISSTILKVNDISSSVAAAVEEQTAATHEITRNVQQAAASTQEVSRNISGVSDAVERAGETAGAMLAAADDLARQAQKLNREVDEFLATVRIA
ncbi:MAG TPA: methyl-accepting chemotaxis protein [Stellaceae bacterium]